MENDIILANDETTVLSAKSNAEPLPVPRQIEMPSDKVVESMFKVTTDMVKEGAATAKDNRIIRKRIVDSTVEANSTNMEVQKTEYGRIVKKLEGDDLQPEERAHYEARAEILSDRIHETQQIHREDMKQNTPPKQKSLPVWGWICLLATGITGGFFGGRYYQSKR